MRYMNELGEPGGWIGATGAHVPGRCIFTTGISTKGVGWVQTQEELQPGVRLCAPTASLPTVQPVLIFEYPALLMDFKISLSDGMAF